MGISRKKKAFVGFSLILVAALVAGLVLSGCAPAPTPATPTPTPKMVEGARIAFLLPNVGPWYNDKWYGFKEEAEKAGMVPTMYSAGGYANVSKQVAQFEDAIAAGYDGIVLHATSGSALIPPVKKALAAGIHVSTEHSPLAERIVPNVWEGPGEAGRILAMVICNDLGGRGKIFVINGPPGQLESLAEEEGFKWVCESFFPEVEVFMEWPTADEAAALKVTEDFLVAHPDVGAIKVWAGPNQIHGTIAALETAGYKPGEIILTASYAIPENFELMREGWIKYLTVGAPVTVGRTSAWNMIKMLKGEHVPLEIDVPMCLVEVSGLDRSTFPGIAWEE